MVLRAKKSIVLLSKYHGSNQQLLALAREISGENVVAVECDVRSRSSLLFKFYVLMIHFKRRLGAESKLSVFLTRIFLKGSIPCVDGDIVIAKTRPFEIPLQLLVAGSKAKACYVGSPRRFKKTEYDYLISTPSTPVADADVSLDVLPTSFTYMQFQQAQKTSLPHAEKVIWTLLIGGNARGCVFSNEDWSSLICFINKASKEAGVFWRITTSPRTGKIVEEMLKDSLIERKGFKGELYLWQLDEIDCPNPFKLLLNASSVFVTEDSASMISEAANTRLPLITLSPSVGEVKNSLTVPLIKHLDSIGSLFRVSIGELELTEISIWKKTNFSALEACWSEQL